MKTHDVMPRHFSAVNTVTGSSALLWAWGGVANMRGSQPGHRGAAGALLCQQLSTRPQKVPACCTWETTAATAADDGAVHDVRAALWLQGVPYCALALVRDSELYDRSHHAAAARDAGAVYAGRAVVDDVQRYPSRCGCCGLLWITQVATPPLSIWNPPQLSHPLCLNLVWRSLCLHQGGVVKAPLAIPASSVVMLAPHALTASVAV